MVALHQVLVHDIEIYVPKEVNALSILRENFRYISVRTAILTLVMLQSSVHVVSVELLLLRHDER
jgi:hypothetical protein